MSVRHVTIVEYKYLFGNYDIDTEKAISELLYGLKMSTAFPVLAGLNHSVRHQKKHGYDLQIFNG